MTSTDNNFESPKEHTEEALEEVRFLDLLFGFSSMALRYMGYNNDSGRPEPKNKNLCRQNISCLEILFKKTQGNLTKEEEDTLNQLLGDLRRKYLAAFPK